MSQRGVEDTGQHEETLHGVAGLEVEMRNRRPLEVDRSVKVECAVVLIIVLCGGTGVFSGVHCRVCVMLAVLVGKRSPGEDGLTSKDRVGVGQGAHGNVFLVGVGEVETDAGLEVFEKLVGSVDTALEPLKIYSVEDTLIFLI